MNLIATKPTGSTIGEREDVDGLTLSWLLPFPSWWRYGIGAFLVFWLCGWAYGWVAVAHQLIVGGPDLFLFGWLGAWTIAGVVVVWMVWQLIRPTRPESVSLKQDFFYYDPGNRSRWLQPPIWGFWPGWHMHGFGDFFGVRKPVGLSRSEVKAFTLERVGERQRLTFDKGADRIEIGACLREPEREWLHTVLEEWRKS